jgi:hypothetical protein
MRKIPLARIFSLALAVQPAFLTGCASSGRLAEFDFRGAALAVVNIAPPRPQVFTADFFDPGGGWLETVVRIGSEMARDAQAERAGEKLAEASEQVDVAGLMAERVLERGAQLLRARPVESVVDADYEIEVRVKEYGIRADSWDSHADFFIQAEVLLLESVTGDRIWKEGVEARDPINPGTWGAGGSLGNIITAQALGRLSVAEMREALEDLAVYSADAITTKLQEGLDRARR